MLASMDSASIRIKTPLQSPLVNPLQSLQARWPSAATETNGKHLLTSQHPPFTKALHHRITSSCLTTTRTLRFDDYKTSNA